MLTIRQNLLETIHGGNPDRFVNQYEFLKMIGNTPLNKHNPATVRGGPPVKNLWGVTMSWPAHVPGQFPVHDYEHRVVKDITKWRDTVKAPSVDFPEEEWADAIAAAEAIDRSEYFVTAMVAPGVFEQVHYLLSIEEALVMYAEEPESMHELIDYITDWEVEWAKQLCSHIKPDALFHHDDWGSHISSFLSPAMFDEFITPAYKKIYGAYKEYGVELIVHHSDSYAANLVPSMIEMGIDIFQGCTTTNNVPELVKKYGGKISFMGDLNNGVCDVENWTPELMAREVERACRTNGKHYFIPCLVRGGPGSIYPGVYEEVSKEIDRMSRLLF